jgi:hypothetical protein
MSAPTPTSTVLSCRNCGRSPAAKVTFKSVQGFVVMANIGTLRGAYCRDCGLKAKAQMNARTLKGAWFSISSLIAMPIYLATNASAGKKLERLGN